MAKTQDEMAQQWARALPQALPEGDHRNLSTTRLRQMVEEVYGLPDQVGAEVPQAVLQQQAERVDQVGNCPSCGKKLQSNDPQTKTVQLRRAKVHWKQPVWRCPGCPRDFFPRPKALGCEVDAKCSPAIT